MMRFHALLSRLVSVFVVLLVAHSAHGADTKPVYVAFDGAYGVKNSTSAQAIELGLRVALSEINANGGVLGGRPLQLAIRDNRSVTARGVANLESFIAMPDMVAMFGGRFSPVILQQLELAHENDMIVLDVWGAVDGITDNKFVPNYAFRLSLKDSWAMPAMVKAARAKGAHNIGVLLPNTGWGRSNEKALMRSLEKTPDMKLAGVIVYNWGERDMLRFYENLVDAGAEAILMVANDLEGSLLVRQLGENPSARRVPIISHWGVTGGNMVEASGPALAELDFSVVQTFSFLNAQPGPLAKFKETFKLTRGVEAVEKLDSPVGVGHAYDMMHILAMAIDAAGSTDRAKVRDALEGPLRYEGLIRTYEPPFSKTSHDALTPDQVFLARYRADGVLVPIQ